MTPENDSDNFECTETTTIFLVSSYQYIFSVLAFCFIGKPYRQPFYTNGMLFEFNPILSHILLISVLFRWSNNRVFFLRPPSHIPPIIYESIAVAFVISLVVMTAVTVYLTISPHEWINGLMGMVEVPMSWRWNIIIIAVVNLVLLLVTEAAIVELFVRRRVQHSLLWKSSGSAGKISSAGRYDAVSVVVESNVEEDLT